MHDLNSVAICRFGIGCMFAGIIAAGGALAICFCQFPPEHHKKTDYDVVVGLVIGSLALIVLGAIALITYG